MPLRKNQAKRMMAASLVTALPVVIMYALSERFIKSGLTAGGVKG